MKIAIVGSRDYPRLDLVNAYVKTLPAGTVVVSGGARGVDQAAETAARQCGLEVISFKADWNRWGKAAGIMRNGDIVRAAEQVVAFWVGSKGTLDTINKALAAKKSVIIFDAKGVQRELPVQR